MNTDTTVVTVFAAVWIVCGVLTYGLLLAHFQRKFRSIAYKKRVHDVAFCISAGFLGPLGLITTFICGFADQGFLWRPLPPDERD